MINRVQSTSSRHSIYVVLYYYICTFDALNQRMLQQNRLSGSIFHVVFIFVYNIPRTRKNETAVDFDTVRVRAAVDRPRCEMHPVFSCAVSRFPVLSRSRLYFIVMVSIWAMRKTQNSKIIQQVNILHGCSFVPCDIFAYCVEAASGRISFRRPLLKSTYSTTLSSLIFQDNIL